MPVEAMRAKIAADLRLALEAIEYVLTETAEPVSSPVGLEMRDLQALFSRQNARLSQLEHKLAFLRRTYVVLTAPPKLDKITASSKGNKRT